MRVFSSKIAIFLFILAFPIASLGAPFKLGKIPVLDDRLKLKECIPLLEEFSSQLNNPLGYETFTKAKRTPPDKTLNLDLLRENSLEYDKTTQTLTDTKDGKQVALGTLQEIDAKFLFEWALTNTHKAWVRRGGFSKADMDASLVAPGQAAGKGYYVSTDPLDSQSYGTALTVYRPQRPLLILTPVRPPANDTPWEDVGGTWVQPVAPGEAPPPFTEISTDTDFVLRLRRAGIDGFQSFSQTWLSIINEDVLGGASGVDREFVKKGLASDETIALNFILGTHSKPYIQKEIAKNFPKKGLYKKVIEKQPLTSQETDFIVKALLKNGQSILVSGGSPNRYLSQSILGPYLERQLSRGDAQGLENALETSITNTFDIRDLASALRQSFKQVTPQQKMYYALLDIFDLVDLQRLSLRDPSSQSGKLYEMKASAQKWLVAEEQLRKLKTAITLNDLVEATKTLIGEEPRFRDSVVFMGPQGNTESIYLKTSPAVAQTLAGNRLLSTKILKSETDPNVVRAYVEYPSAKNYDRYRWVLSESLQKDLDALPESQRTDPANPNARELTSRIVQELTVALFDPATRASIVALVYGFNKGTDLPPTFVTSYTFLKAFISIHPLEDGNGRMSRLLFRYMSIEELDLTLPIFDLDLLTPEWDFSGYVKIGLILNNWISRATSDEDFLFRAHEALKIFIGIRPQLKAIFPEL